MFINNKLKKYIEYFQPKVSEGELKSHLFSISPRRYFKECTI